jgi:hypothetical protein
MSHFSVTVATAADDADEAAEYISTLLDPFNENLEVEQHTEDGETWWRNPNAKWDWWMVGGRWSGDLRLRRGARRSDYLRGERSWTNENEPIDWGTCDGGRIRALDLAAMRTSAATKAVEDWNEYAVVVDGTPQHLPWQVFADRVDAATNAPDRKPKNLLEQEGLGRALADFGLADMAAVDALKQADQNRHHEFLDRAIKELEAADAAWQASGYTLDKARADYAAQPRIAALRAHPGYHNFLLTGPEDIFEHRDRDEYAQLARAKAVPGYALLTDDGRWIEPGRMGWWGRSTETDESMDTYLSEANAYIDGLSPQMWLAVVDCHI